MKRESLICLIFVNILFLSLGCGNRREIEASFRTAEWLEKRGNHRAAIVRYEKVLELAPRSDFSRIARMRIGEIHYKRLRDYARAKSIYNEVLQFYPDSPHAREAEKKLEEIEKVLHLKKDVLQKGDSLFEGGRFGRALEKYREAESLDPSSPAIKAKIRVAIEIYEEQRKTAAASAVEKGDQFISQGKYEEAIQEYHRARELTPETVEVWNKIDAAMAHLAPIKRDRAFEKNLSDATALDLYTREPISSLLEKFPSTDRIGEEDKQGDEPKREVEGGSASEIYWMNFSIELLDYNHYFQGYKLLWCPNEKLSIVRFIPGEYYFPFLKVPMMKYEKFEALCRDSGGRPTLKGVALFTILGRNGMGGISAELIDARLAVPGRDFLYVLQTKGEEAH